MIDNIKNVVFYNNHNESVVHLSKIFVKKYIELFNVENYYYAHNFNYPLISGLENISTIYDGYDLKNFDQISYYKLNDTLLINMWVGQENPKYSNDYNNYDTHCKIHKKNIFNLLNIQNVDYEFLPTINDNLCDVNYVNNTIDGMRGFNDIFILICNEPTLTSNGFHFSDDFLKNLLDYIFTYKHNTKIILTSYFKYDNPNVMIWDKDENINDISYLSKRMHIILGNLSNKHYYTFLAENIINKNIISLCDNESEGLWFNKFQNEISWSNNYDFENITKIIDKKLKIYQ